MTKAVLDKATKHSCALSVQDLSTLVKLAVTPQIRMFKDLNYICAQLRLYGMIRVHPALLLSPPWIDLQ